MIRAVAVIVSFLVVASVARAQGIGAIDWRPLGPADSTILLSHEFIVSGSLRLQLDSVYVLQSPLDYVVNERFGTVSFTPFFRRLLQDTSRPHRIVAEYRYRPIAIDRERFRRSLVTITDSTGTSRTVAQERVSLTSASIFGKGFQRSGSIVRGVTIGSNRDLSLQSGLRLQFSGHITEDVEVLGALTDEETPIQPEGNTQTLREIDNIFIEFRSPYVGATVGKFSAGSAASEYTAFARRLQGVRAVGRVGSYGSAEVVAAVSPGKFRTQLIAGRERDQGPYRLTGPSGERSIVVVAGTEHVFVDGVEMVRGENNDYVIDYGTAEVFFQTRRPITSASRITVDFEYTDRQYSRSFIAGSAAGNLFDSTVNVVASWVREADNPDATIDITLDENDRALLAAAGGDPLRAVRSGVYFVGRSDSNRGSYYRIDTTINGLPDSVFRYAPDDPASVYAISFSVAPDGRGDYRSVAFGQYEFVGKGLGSYLPVIYLPMPQLRQVAALRLSARPSRAIFLSAEGAISDANLNRFSLDPLASTRGGAFTASATASTDSLWIGNANIGAIRFNATGRYLSGGFRSLERLGEVEFSNKWNTSSRLGESGTNDVVAEGTLVYRPIDRLELAAQNGYLSRGPLFNSFRQLYGVRYFGDTTVASADYTIELISTKDTILGGLRGSWTKQRGGVSRRFGIFTAGARFETEDRQDRGDPSRTDTLYPSSFRYLEGGPELALSLPFLNATARARYRIDDSVRYDSAAGTGGFLRDGTSQTYTIRGELRGVRSLSSTLDFTWRRKGYDSIAGLPASTRLANVTILARSQTRWTSADRGVDLEGLYDVQTEQAARLQRIFIRVPFGQGEYVWIDYDSNSVQSENEFRLTNAGDGEYRRFDFATERLYPVINLHTSARARIDPKRFLSDSTYLGRFLSIVTSETTLRLEEKSQDQEESNVYLLKIGRMQNDSTTIEGNSLVQQDLNLFEGNPEYSFRLRYASRRGLTRLYNAIERTEGIERSFRTKWQPTYDIGLQLDLAANNTALRSSDTLSNRTFELASLSAANDFSYRPTQSLELGYRLRLAGNDDALPRTPRSAFINTNEVRAIYSLETFGSLQARLERTEVSGENLGTSEIALPYQLTEGYAIGATWIGTLRFEYRFGTNVQVGVTYIGRAQPPTNVVIHTGQAEVRAFF